MKLLITGASGLLGSDIVYAAEQKNIDIVKLCHTPRDGFIDVDITTEEGISTVSDLEWDAVIHTAAWRNPDICENKTDETYRINVWTSEKLAELAAERSAKFVYICTDYVFSGSNPPYAEDSEPSPVNYYGKSKLLGAQKVIDKIPEASSLRVPLLYGIRAGLEMSALLNGTLTALESKEKWQMEDSIIRYPTYTGDVANATLLLLEKSEGGIFHFSGQDRTTRYKITELFAEILGKSMENIQHLETPPATEARRPKDAHLTMDKILELGMPAPLCFAERVKLLFKELNIIS